MRKIRIDLLDVIQELKGLRDLLPWGTADLRTFQQAIAFLEEYRELLPDTATELPPSKTAATDESLKPQLADALAPANTDFDDVPKPNSALQDKLVILCGAGEYKMEELVAACTEYQAITVIHNDAFLCKEGRLSMVGSLSGSQAPVFRLSR
jgi:hypothetical protein